MNIDDVYILKKGHSIFMKSLDDNSTIQLPGRQYSSKCFFFIGESCIDTEFIIIHIEDIDKNLDRIMPKFKIRKRDIKDHCINITPSGDEPIDINDALGDR